MKPVTIMLVDDDHTTNFVNKKILSQTYPTLRIIDFTSVDAAIAYLKNPLNKKPNILFLDIDMPNKDGWDFLDELDHLNLDVEIHMLTSSISSFDRSRSNQHHLVSGFMTKPINLGDIDQIFSSYSTITA